MAMPTKIRTSESVKWECISLLKILAKRHFATTSQAHSQLRLDRHTQKTREDLNWLKKHRLVVSFPYQPHKGTASELCWLLTGKGANVLEVQAGIKLKFGSSYRRHPEAERIDYRTRELALEDAIAAAGCGVITPVTYNQYCPRPVRTPQYLKLAEYLTYCQRTLYGQLGADLFGPHTLPIPLKANDYVAYSLDNRLAVVLILPPPRATNKFWQSRLKEYRLLADEMLVVVIFDSEAEARKTEKHLRPSKIRLAASIEGVTYGLKDELAKLSRS